MVLCPPQCFTEKLVHHRSYKLEPLLLEVEAAFWQVATKLIEQVGGSGKVYRLFNWLVGVVKKKRGGGGGGGGNFHTCVMKEHFMTSKK